MKRYPSYKDSGIEWIGEIPEHWEETKVKNILAIPITDGPHSTPQFYESGIPFLSADSVKNNKLDFSRMRGYISQDDYEEFSKKYVPIKGDIYMVKSGATTGNIAIVETDEIFTIWSPLAVFRANNKKVYFNYLFKFLQSNVFRHQVELNWSYGTQQNIGMGVLSNLYITYPKSIQEQTQIANYLDHQTGIIDQLIKKKKQLTEKLKEQRQAIINEAVTKGLDSDVKLKDSGIEWIGEIPEHWEVSFLKRFADKITDGSHHSPKTETVGRNYVSVKDVDSFGKINLDDCKKISEEDFDILVRNGCQPKPNDVLLTKDGTIGRAAIVQNDNFVILSSLGLIRPKSEILYPKFLRFYLTSGINIDQMFSFIAGSALTRLTIDKIKHLLITIPPLQEQTQIAAYLDHQTGIIDQILEKTKLSIEKLEEQRRSIISEAVTGKVDVRDWEK